MPEKMLPTQRARFLPVRVLALALAILGGTIFYGADRLRRNLREQLINHDGEMLHAVAQAQSLFLGGTELASRLSDPAEQMAFALQLSQLHEGVMAVRLFGETGSFITAFPPYVSEAELTPAALQQLRQLRPVNRYRPNAHLADLFVSAGPADGAATNSPLLEVNLPMPERGGRTLLGCAQLVLDGRKLEAAFAQLDRDLIREATLAFAVSGVLLCAALGWAYRRIEQGHVLLRDRTERLLRANHELSLANKTGALGAVSAHLVHGLNNPLANLQEFIARRADAAGADWRDAAVAARRMQALVQEVVRVLGEEAAAERYELSFDELAQILCSRLTAMAQAEGVRLDAHCTAGGVISNRQANLILLILENLATNAIQVTPRDHGVSVTMERAGDRVVCEVADEGPGVPTELREALFSPCRSTKGGSGLGLAISRQLANQLGARLELFSTGSSGSVFRLELPLSILEAPNPPAV